MIMSRSAQGQFRSVFAFTTFFYPKLKSGGHGFVKLWTKAVDIFRYSLILVLVHLGDHWTLAAIDMEEKSMTYFDSLGGSKPSCLRSLAVYVKQEHLSKKGVRKPFFVYCIKFIFQAPLLISCWSLEVAKNTPLQANLSDCGVFVLKTTECLSR